VIYLVITVGENENIEHVLFECTKLNIETNIVVVKLNQLGIDKCEKKQY